MGLPRAVLVIGVLLLSSCSHLDPTTAGVRGMPPTLEQIYPNTATGIQKTFVDNLIATAGLSAKSPLATRDPDWSLVAEAGIYEIGRQCDQYIDALFRFNRDQRAFRQGLTAAGAATASILGLAGVAAMPIAITAVAFGLSATLFDASVNSVLFTIEPSALRNVVLQGRKKYLDDIDIATVDTRPRMLIFLQGYLTQCSPAAIEANINNAASGAESVVSTNPLVARRAATDAAPAASLLKTERPNTDNKLKNAETEIKRQQDQIDRLTREQTRIRNSAIQAALCVPVSGTMGEVTLQAVRNFNRGASGTESTQIPKSLTDLAEGLRLQSSTSSACKEDGYMNAFEAGVFGYLPDARRNTQLRSLLTEINTKMGSNSFNVNGGIPELRKAITEFRTKVTPDNASKALDPDLMHRIYQ